MHEVKMNERSLTVGTLTAGQVAALAPLVVRLKPHFGPDGVDLGVLLAELPAIVEAAAQLLGVPRAEVEALGLAAFTDLLGELAEALIAANAAYLEAEVAPAVTRLSARITRLAAAFSGAAHGAPGAPG